MRINEMTTTALISFVDSADERDDDHVVWRQMLHELQLRASTDIVALFAAEEVTCLPTEFVVLGDHGHTDAESEASCYQRESH